MISTKAGYDMAGPYGDHGSRKYLLSSLDQSLARMGLPYVDIFYLPPRRPGHAHREETMGALDTAVRQGKALYAGISSYPPERTRQAAEILRGLGTPLLIHQPSYSMLNRWIEEDGLLNVLEEEGAGCIVFSPLAQGLLTDRYLDGVPEDHGPAGRSRSAATSSARPPWPRCGPCASSPAARPEPGQLAIAWALRDPGSLGLLGASSVAQLEANVAALDNLDFDADELAEIDRHATEAGINLWEPSSRA